MKVKTLSISSHLESPHKGAPMYVVASFWAIKCKEGRARPKKRCHSSGSGHFAATMDTLFWAERGATRAGRECQIGSG